MRTLALVLSLFLCLSANAQERLRGIDISHHQGQIDWQKVKQDSVNFAFMKASQGTKLTDKRFAENRKAVEAAEIPWSAYHFYVTSRGGEEQARYFMSVVGKKWEAPLPPVVDVERFDGGSKQDLVKELKIFLETIESEWNVRPIIYSGDYFWRDNLKGDFKIYPIWIARYRKAGPEYSHWTFWQYSEKGTVSGISGPVDLNYFSGDAKTLSQTNGRLTPHKKLLKGKGRAGLVIAKQKYQCAAIDLEAVDGHKSVDKKKRVLQIYIRQNSGSKGKAPNVEDAKDIARLIASYSKKKRKYAGVMVIFQKLEGGKAIGEVSHFVSSEDY